jgi:ribonuclease BN (tRNA processing enzyme)
VLGDFRSEPPDWIDGFAIAENVDVLFHDSQYTATEYEVRRGWGHSSFVDAVAYAQVTGTRRLVMFHHDPGHSDATLEDIQEQARVLWGRDGTPPSLAAANMTIDLSEAALDTRV